MNKMLYLLLVAVMTASCGTSENAPSEKKDTSLATVPEQPPVKFIYPSTFPADWTIGDPKNILKVQEMYRILMSDSNYEALRSYLADSITNVYFDNRKETISADQFIKLVKQFRKEFKTLNEEFRNYVTLHSDTQNTDLVLVWLKEKGVRRNGKTDSSGYQETWKLNKDGKFDYRSTYVRYDF